MYCPKKEQSYTIFVHIHISNKFKHYSTQSVFQVCEDNLFF